MRNVGERWCNRGFPRLLPYKMNKRMFVITQTTAVHKFISVVCCSFSARIYRPLPGLKSSNADFFGFFSPEPCIRFLIGLLHLLRKLKSSFKMSTSGRISPAAFIGCDGSRYLTPLQRSACDYAEVSLLLSHVMASPYVPYGFCGCGPGC